MKETALLLGEAIRMLAEIAVMIAVFAVCMMLITELAKRHPLCERDMSPAACLTPDKEH